MGGEQQCRTGELMYVKVGLMCMTLTGGEYYSRVHNWRTGAQKGGRRSYGSLICNFFTTCHCMYSMKFRFKKDYITGGPQGMTGVLDNTTKEMEHMT